MRRLPAVLATVALATIPLVPPAHAEVTAVSAQGFVVQHVLSLPAPPDVVYRALTGEVGQWWNPDHSFSGDAANFTLDDRAGGCFCEALPGGGSVEHLRVVFAQPGKMLRLTGGLGPLQALAVAGTMQYRLTEEDGMTRLDFQYAVGGFVPGGLESLAAAVDQVLGEQLQRLAAYLGR
jgi:uncharacterized protein YndB with AHSA1/START domain